MNKKLLLTVLAAGLVFPSATALANNDKDPNAPYKPTPAQVEGDANAKVNKAAGIAELREYIANSEFEKQKWTQEVDKQKKIVENQTKLYNETQAEYDKLVQDLANTNVNTQERLDKEAALRQLATALGQEKHNLDWQGRTLAKLQDELKKSEAILSELNDELAKKEKELAATTDPKAKEKLEKEKKELEQKRKMEDLKAKALKAKTGKTGAKKLPKTSAAK